MKQTSIAIVIFTYMFEYMQTLFIKHLQFISQPVSMIDRLQNIIDIITYDDSPADAIEMLDSWQIGQFNTRIIQKLLKLHNI